MAEERSESARKAVLARWEKAKAEQPAKAAQRKKRAEEQRMAEATATGNVCLAFQSAELITHETWELFRKWVGTHLIGTACSSKRVPGWHYEAQVCYTTKTFDTEKDFVNETRELVHRVQLAGRMPRSVYRVEAIYWLGSLQDAEMPWHATIDLDKARNELLPQLGEIVWIVDDDEHSKENLVQEWQWRDGPDDRRLWAAGRIFRTREEALQARDKLFPPKPFKPPKYY